MHAQARRKRRTSGSDDEQVAEHTMRCRRRIRVEYDEGQGIDNGRMQSRRTDMPVRSTAYRTQRTHDTRPCPHYGDNDEGYFESPALSPPPAARYREEVDGELNYWYGSKHGTPPYSRPIFPDDLYEAIDAGGEEYGANGDMRTAQDHRVPDPSGRAHSSSKRSRTREPSQEDGWEISSVQGREAVRADPPSDTRPPGGRGRHVEDSAQYRQESKSIPGSSSASIHHHAAFNERNEAEQSDQVEHDVRYRSVSPSDTDQPFHRARYSPAPEDVLRLNGTSRSYPSSQSYSPSDVQQEGLEIRGHPKALGVNASPTDPRRRRDVEGYTLSDRLITASPGVEMIRISGQTSSRDVRQARTFSPANPITLLDRPSPDVRPDALDMSSLREIVMIPEAKRDPYKTHEISQGESAKAIIDFFIGGHSPAGPALPVVRRRPLSVPEVNEVTPSPKVDWRKDKAFQNPKWFSDASPLSSKVDGSRAGRLPLVIGQSVIQQRSLYRALEKFELELVGLDGQVQAADLALSPTTAVIFHSLASLSTTKDDLLQRVKRAAIYYQKVVIVFEVVSFRLLDKTPDAEVEASPLTPEISKLLGAFKRALAVSVQPGVDNIIGEAEAVFAVNGCEQVASAIRRLAEEDDSRISARCDPLVKEVWGSKQWAQQEHAPDDEETLVDAGFNMFSIRFILSLVNTYAFFAEKLAANERSKLFASGTGTAVMDRFNNLYEAGRDSATTKQEERIASTSTTEQGGSKVV